MKRIEILINGKPYPCCQTMGAMLRFKELTGKEATEINPRSLSDLCKFLWCCVVSACEREKREFPLSLMEFADSIGDDEMRQWQEMVAEEQKKLGQADGGGEKKSPPGSANS